jgi:hypothetical protein
MAFGADGRTYQQYFDQRKLLADGERAAAEGFDKTLLTLSAGAIALSVTFVEKVGSAGMFKPLLYVSWMDDEHFRRGRTVLRNPFRTRAENFNQWSYWLFLAGILLLLLFAGVNYEMSSTGLLKGSPSPWKSVKASSDHSLKD